jgi:hypothetical protein
MPGTSRETSCFVITSVSSKSSISTIVIEKAGERGTDRACWLVSVSAVETVATEELKQAA